MFLRVRPNGVEWTGASRYIHCDWLRQDQTLATIFGYESLPSQSTYSRFFGKFSQARNTAVFPELQAGSLSKSTWVR